jgi:voltage-gated potassium channel
LQQLSRTARVYRMRGLAMRAWRALLVLEIVRRILHGRPEQRLKKVEDLILLKQQELTDLEAERQRLLEQLGATALPAEVERVA